MYRKKVSKFIGVFILLCFLFSLASVSSAKTITFKYVEGDQPVGMRERYIKKFFLPEIEKQTGGQVKVQDFWGGTLLTVKEILKGLNDNVANMGMVYPGYHPGELPVFTIFKVFPEGPTKLENIIWLYRKVYEEVPEFSEEVKRFNQKTIMFTSGLSAAFCGKKSLDSLDNIKGDKWRAGDKYALRYLKNAGAVPVSVPWLDVYMSLQTGVIDGVFTNYDAVRKYKFDEVAPNILITKKFWMATPFIHNVNLDYWNKLPKDVQQGILKACKLLEQNYAKVYDEGFDKIMAEQKKLGVKVKMMSEDDVAKWANEEKLDQMRRNWVEESSKAGVKNAAQVMEKVRMIHKQALEREK